MRRRRSRCAVRPFILFSCVVLLGSGALARSGPDAEDATIHGLRPEAFEALRRAAWSTAEDDLHRHGLAALVDRARAEAPELTDEDAARLAHVLERDVALRTQLADVREVAARWRDRPGEALVFWWNPRQREVSGLPARAPTNDEVRELERVARRLAERHGLAPPVRAPLRIDLDASGRRVFGRDDLRWGLVTPHRVDRTGVARLVLADLGDLPALVAALAHLHGEAGADPNAREALLDQARRVVIEAGHVRFEDALRAGHVTGPDDPALASLLLAVDRLERRVPPRAFTALMRALTPEAGPSELRDAVIHAFGETPRRIDREVLRELSLWDVRRRERAR